MEIIAMFHASHAYAQNVRSVFKDKREGDLPKRLELYGKSFRSYDGAVSGVQSSRLVEENGAFAGLPGQTVL
jgi:hypothetical protein